MLWSPYDELRLQSHAATPESQRSRSSDQDDHGHHDQHQAERDRGVGVGLESEVDLGRHGPRGAGKLPGEGDGRAELAERARPAKNGARHDAGQRERAG